MPYTIKADSRKISLVEVALGQLFASSERGWASKVGAVAYGLFGYDGRSDFRDGGEGQQPDDDEIGMDVVAKRRHLQAEIAATGLGIGRKAASLLIEILKPSSRFPSISAVKRFYQTLHELGIPLYDDSRENVVRHWLVRMNLVQADDEEIVAVASGTTMFPEGAMDYLEEIFGWSFVRRTPVGHPLLLHVADAPAEVGAYSVFMSPLLPDHGGNVTLGKSMSMVERQASNALLLFNHPTMYSRQAAEKNFLFGGLMLKEGRWERFYLYPGHGIEGAEFQHSSRASTLGRGPDLGLSFDRAAFLCRCMTSVASGEMIGKTDFRPYRYGEFLAFVPPFVAARLGPTR
jgi:hypothetical protein